MVNDIREALAAYAHTAWSGWMNHLFEKCPVRLDSDDRTMSAHWAERWGRQMNTPYAELTEEEKESDRAEANKMLEIIQSFPTETSGEIEKELEGLAEWIERHDWGCLQVRDYLSTVQKWVEAVQATIPLDGKIIQAQKVEIARLQGEVERVRDITLYASAKDGLDYGTRMTVEKEIAERERARQAALSAQALNDFCVKAGEHNWTRFPDGPRYCGVCGYSDEGLNDPPRPDPLCECGSKSQPDKEGDTP